ncbi:hypothetical protein ACP90_01785 [Labrenzia sp. CP4]|jgi:hypothetical protein|nr:hypothetical protein ACP90_01785 [Labrenzia sp. CP4]
MHIDMRTPAPRAAATFAHARTFAVSGNAAHAHCRLDANLLKDRFSKLHVRLQISQRLLSDGMLHWHIEETATPIVNRISPKTLVGMSFSA